MKNKSKNDNILCSFCGLPQDEVNLLIEGDHAHICDLCIIKSKDILANGKYLKKFYLMI